MPEVPVRLQPARLAVVLDLDQSDAIGGASPGDADHEIGEEPLADGKDQLSCLPLVFWGSEPPFEGPAFIAVEQFGKRSLFLVQAFWKHPVGAEASCH